MLELEMQLYTARNFSKLNLCSNGNGLFWRNQQFEPNDCGDYKLAQIQEAILS